MIRGGHPVLPVAYRANRWLQPAGQENRHKTLRLVLNVSGGCTPLIGRRRVDPSPSTFSPFPYVVRVRSWPGPATDSPPRPITRATNDPPASVSLEAAWPASCSFNLSLPSRRASHPPRAPTIWFRDSGVPLTVSWHRGPPPFDRWPDCWPLRRVRPKRVSILPLLGIRCPCRSFTHNSPPASSPFSALLFASETIERRDTPAVLGSWNSARIDSAGSSLF